MTSDYDIWLQSEVLRLGRKLGTDVELDCPFFDLEEMMEMFEEDLEKRDGKKEK